MQKNAKNANKSSEVSSVIYWNTCFLLPALMTLHSRGAPVVSSEVDWPRFTFQCNDSSWNCLFTMSQKICSHFGNSSIEVRMRPAIVALKIGPIHLLSLINSRARTLRARSPIWAKNLQLTSREGPHNCTHASLFLHLTPHSVGRPHIATLVQDHTGGLVRPAKDLIRPHSRHELDLMRPSRKWHRTANRKTPRLLSERCVSPGILLVLFHWQVTDIIGHRKRNVKKELWINVGLFFLLGLGGVCLTAKMSELQDGWADKWLEARPGVEKEDWEGFPWVGTGRLLCDGKLSNSFHRLPEDWSFTRARWAGATGAARRSSTKPRHGDRAGDTITVPLTLPSHRFFSAHSHIWARIGGSCQGLSCDHFLISFIINVEDFCVNLYKFEDPRDTSNCSLPMRQ